MSVNPTGPTSTESPTAAAPATASTEATATDVVTPAEGEAPAAEAPSAEDLFWAKFNETDPDELIKRNPRLQGKVGALAQKQAQQAEAAATARLRAEHQAEQTRQEAALRQAELLNLADTDPDRLAERFKEDAAKQRQSDIEEAQFDRWKSNVSNGLEAQYNEVYDDPEFREIFDASDDVTKASFDHHNHPNVKSWMRVLTNAYADHRVKSQVEKRAEEIATKRIAAATKSDQIENMASEASQGIDLGVGGATPGGRIFRRSELAEMKRTSEGRAEWKKHREAIEYQADHGLIEDDVGGRPAL